MEKPIKILTTTFYSANKSFFNIQAVVKFLTFYLSSFQMSSNNYSLFIQVTIIIFHFLWSLQGKKKLFSLEKKAKCIQINCIALNLAPIYTVWLVAACTHDVRKPSFPALSRARMLYVF